MKKKYKHLRDLFISERSRTLSDEAAVEIHELLETIASSFLARHAHRIQRYYAKHSKRKLNELEPWRYSNEPF